MTVTGSVSDWAYSANASIEMTDGVLDFTECGIGIVNSNVFTENITGGVIKTTRYFTCNRTDYNPAGGTLEFYGTGDWTISKALGSTLHDVEINKSTKGGTFSSGMGGIVKHERTGEIVSFGGKANSITQNSDIAITNELNIMNGEYILGGHVLTVAHDCDVYNGILTMANGLDIFNCGSDSYDQLRFNNGSIGNLSAGVINLPFALLVYTGASVTATTANTINFGTSLTFGGIVCQDPNMVLGNINVNMAGGKWVLDAASTYDFEVNGNFNLYPGNAMEMYNNTLIIHGVMTDDATSEIYVYDGPVKGKGSNLKSLEDEPSGGGGVKGGYLEIDTDFTLNGLLDVADGDVLLHGDFHIAATGILDITTGSVIADQPYSLADAWQNMSGTINLTNGLFELSHNSFNFTSTAVNNISGGTLRCGFTFSALYAGTFQPIGGLVEFTGTGYDARIEMDASNYFNDVVINRTESVYLGTDIYIQNDLEINSGQLFAYDYALLPHDCFLGGNWTNTAGNAAFDEGTGTVTFNGTGNVAINNNETFYNLTVDKVNLVDAVDLLGDVDVLGNLTLDRGELHSNDNVLSVYGNATLNSSSVMFMEPNSTLAFGAGSQLVSYNGSAFYAVGSAGNEPLVTHMSTGTYGFSIWGTIGAQNAIFEYMDGNGINVKDGGYVHPTFTFNNCTFRDGAPSPSALLVLNHDQVFTCDDARFEQNTLGNTGYNVWKAIDHGDVLFNNATGDFAGEVYDYDPFNRVDWLNIGFTVSGNVTYANGGSTALSIVTVNLMDGVVVVASDVSDGSGDYEFVDIPDGTYHIESSTLKAWGGLSMNDVQLARQHVVNPLVTLTGLHFLAGDVDEDGFVLMNDVMAMWQEQTGGIPGFTHFWIFEEPIVIVSGASVTQDFEGICSGDTDGSYVPPAAE